MQVFLWIILMKVVTLAVIQSASVTYQWPVCHKSFTYETEQGTGLPTNENNYTFDGSFSSVPCTPISFDGDAHSHMDLNVNSSVAFEKITLSVFIYPTYLTGIIFHYRSASLLQEFILLVVNGRLGMQIYDHGIVVGEGRLDLKSITINHWFFAALIIKSRSNIELQLQLSSAPQTMSKSAEIKSYPLQMTGQIRIGSKIEQVIHPNGTRQGVAIDIPGFKGRMICVQLYKLIFQTADYTSAIENCKNAKFPDPQLIPTTQAPVRTTTPRTICSQYGRDDILFTRVHGNRTLKSRINHLRKIKHTSLRKCAVYCVSRTGCVSFTVNQVDDEHKTCRLFPVYNEAYVTTSFDTNLYVINVCR